MSTHTEPGGSVDDGRLRPSRQRRNMLLRPRLTPLLTSIMLLAGTHLIFMGTFTEARIFGKNKRKNVLTSSDLKDLDLKGRKEKIRAAIESGQTVRLKGRKPIRPGAQSINPRVKKPVRTRIKKRARGFSRVKRSEGLSSVLFPGMSPEEFYEGEEIPMWVDWVNSEKAQVPFSYYSLPVCPGPTVMQTERLRKNLGAKLQGHEVKPSPYAFHALQDRPCTPVCSVEVPLKKLALMRKLVDRRYRVQATMDSLPVRMGSQEGDDSLPSGYAVRGYPLGFRAPPAMTNRNDDGTDFYLYNHVKFVVRYREDPQSFEGVRIVGFEAIPVSIDHVIPDNVDPSVINSETWLETCNPEDSPHPENVRDTLLPLTVDRGEVSLTVVYSYEVRWIESPVHWSDRWDAYMIGSPDDRIHYFSILNSLTVVFILSVIVATVMVRTLKKDIARYNEQFDVTAGTDALVEEEGGWKLLHGDVFRPPTSHPKLLCLAVGTGAQLATVVVLTILSGVMGFMSPTAKDQTLTAFVVLFVLSGGVAGYFSSRMFKLFDDRSWKFNTILIAVAFPGVLVAMFLILDICLAIAGAASAVKFLTILLLFVLWVCVSTPLVFVGSYLGYRGEIKVPVKTNQIARAIPTDALTGNNTFYVRVPYSILLGGFLPFASAVLEIFFIMNALWLHQIYYIMGFLLLVVFIVALTSAEVSVVFCYLQLCAEDHGWWWRAFLNTAGAGLYLMAYSLWFATAKLHLVGFLPAMVYFTYMSMISLAFALVCGSVGFLCTLFFVRSIYGAVKVD